jgi:hypothetical protein
MNLSINTTKNGENRHDYVEGGPIHISRCHPGREKISLDVSSNRVDTSVKRSRCSTRCRGDNKQSVVVHQYMTCRIEEPLLKKPWIFYIVIVVVL